MITENKRMYIFTKERVCRYNHTIYNVAHKIVAQLLKSTKAIRTQNYKYRDKLKPTTMLVIAFYLVLSNLCGIKAQTRDPRFFSRPGVSDYNWPNPGDPDYR